MADPRVRQTVGPLLLRAESGKLLLPDTVAARIENMVPTEEGTLRSVNGPAPYNWTRAAQGVTAAPYTYPGQMHGICHAVINNGQREILLVHSADQILEFRGWTNTWACLLGPSSATPEHVTAAIYNDSTPRAPTQFEAVPNGVVVMPQGSRPFFYDGIVMAPLGFDRIPAAPYGLGPTSRTFIEDSTEATDTDAGINADGYAHDAVYYTKGAMLPDFGVCRLGTVQRYPGATGTDAADPKGTAGAAVGSAGILLEGRYRAAVMWIDRWGNLSPQSGRSNTVKFDQQRSRWYDDTKGAGNKWQVAKVDLVQKQVCWTAIEQGPSHTVGRILLRTKDELNAGTTDLFEVPANAAEGTYAYATIPDNIARVYPDNCPDAWLIRRPVEPVPVGRFTLAKLWDGRLWAAGYTEDPGKLHPSMSGKWGTFLRGDERYPDPQGKGITALWRVSSGLLVTSETNTFLIARSDDAGGDIYQQKTLSATAGCVAPSSMATLPDGRVIWLGREGFYVYDGESVTLCSDPLLEVLKHLNRPRAVQACASVDVETGEYRCWVCMDSSRVNNLCLVFDGAMWRRRSDVVAVAVCMTQDHRHYQLVAGQSTDSGSTTRNGVWILDHEVYGYAPAARSATIETSWLANSRPNDRNTPLSVQLWLRETTLRTLSVSVARDWRSSEIEAVDATSDPPAYLYPTEDAPPFWGQETYGAATTAPSIHGVDAKDNVWRRRRPFKRRVDVGIGACESYRLTLSSTASWEFIGLSLDENPKERGGARVSP